MQEPKDQKKETKAPAKKQTTKAKAEGVTTFETPVASASFDPPISQKVNQALEKKLQDPHGVNQFRSVINSVTFAAGYTGRIRVTRK